MVKSLLLKNLQNEYKKQKITELLEQKVELTDKEIVVCKRLIKKLRMRKQFFQDVLKSQQTIENLALVIKADKGGDAE